MTRRLLERSVESRVVKKAVSLGAIALKLNNRSSAGWPDRLILCPGGKAVFIEFKRSGEFPRALQSYRLQQLKDLGYVAEWADNYDDAVRYIARAMETSCRATKSR